jgi:hypothetical protein
MYGREDVALFLLDHGADLGDPADTGATGLHWAAGAGHVGIVRRLIERGAPLEAVNAWGGTVLEHAGYGFEHGAPGIEYTPTFEVLLAAGATIRGHWLQWIETATNRTPAEKASAAAVFRRHGATT